MIPSRETLVDLSNRTRFDPRQVEIVLRLRDLLGAIERDEFLKPRLALKGGTPLNLCFGAPPRLSVDLDFNYLGEDRETMLAERDPLIAGLEKLARRAGYSIQKSEEAHAGQTLSLWFQSALGNRARLQVDVNFQFRLSLLPTQSLGVWDPLAEGDVKVCVVSRQELVAGKILALVNRTAPRDLYDVSRIASEPDRFGADPTARKIFIALSAILPRALSDYTLDKLDRVRKSDIESLLHPLLRSDERPSFDALVSGTSRILASWLDLSDHEHEYVRLLQVGYLHPELVFDEGDPMVERLRRHPVALWKVENARKHAGRSSST